MSQQQAQNTVIANRKQALERMRGMLDRSAPAFNKVASRYLKPDRLLKVGLANFSRTPELLDCTPQSILLAFMQSAELGLEPGSAKKEAYLIPFRNKKLGGKLEALFLPSYGGLATIARRSGEIIDIESRIVLDGDVFDVDYGENKIVHRPMPPADDKERGVIAAWSRAWFKGGHTKFEWLWYADVEKVRASSRSGDQGPWMDWYEEMAKKTAVRRLYKLLPKSDEMALAEEIDDGEAGDRYGDLINFTSNVIDIQSSGGGRTGQLAQELKKKPAAAQETQSSPPATDDDSSVELSDAEKAQIEKDEKDQAKRDKTRRGE